MGEGGMFYNSGSRASGNSEDLSFLGCLRLCRKSCLAGKSLDVNI